MASQAMAMVESLMFSTLDHLVSRFLLNQLF